VAGKSGRTVNWLLWGGLGAAALAFACILGVVFCNAINPPGGKETPTSTALPLARATPTFTALPLARATPTATPGRPAPTSSVGILFSDDFASMSESEGKGWTFESGDNVDWSWSANALSASVQKKNWIGWNSPDGEYDDFGAEIEAQPSSSGYVEYGIIFRISGETDTRSYYIFCWTSEGKYFLQKKVDGKWADTDPVNTTSSQLIKQGQARNRLGVQAQGDQISLYINGSLVKTVNDDSVSSGTLGVFAGTGDNDQAGVTFSRLTILSAEQAAADWGK